MNIRQLPDVERPREKLLREGKEKLSTSEILAILIGSGTSKSSALEVAGNVMTLNSKGISFLSECKPEEIMTVKGIGKAKACEILAAVELGKRIATAPVSHRQLLRSAEDVAEMFMERMRYYKKEHFISVMVNAKGEVIEVTEVSIGDLCSSTTHPREVFVDAVRRSAGSVVFLHNHPSGDPNPSEVDILTTKRLIEAGNILGIPVLDHIVIGDGEFVSMKAKGYI
ncbi:MAG: DNA repair protein RadC [Clostridiales bacterium]|nr:DNA repair protein RadC [Clostridiales bacterium]